MGYKILNISLLFYISSVIIEQSDCEIFSAIEELEKLAANEQVLIYELEKLANQVNDDYVHR